ncbi:integrase core domain-containing protein [Thermohalobacter berrensis]|uniref:integrase core domain-containing protein n=1 Tax=Thermohalobacter berrensis TaxID=99594 RepID=UPI000E710BF3|nr:integrase core domain-containing protein [Thermohalobacter berrensis]
MKKVKSLGLNISFSNKGNPYDNAPIESFHSILKKEEVYHKKYRDFNDAKKSILYSLSLGTIEKEYTVVLII